MLKTCYGLCSLRTGVKIVAFYELIRTILFFLGVFVYEMYNKIRPFYGTCEGGVHRSYVIERVTSDDFRDHETSSASNRDGRFPLFLADDDVNVYYFIQSCVIIITLLKLFSGMSLMQATFQNAPYKIFVWLVIDCIVYLTTFIVSIKLYVHKVYVGKLFVAESGTAADPVTEWHLLAFIVIVNLVSIMEITVVASYYKEEKLAENAEQYERMQDMMRSLKNHGGVNVFGVDFARPSSARLEEPSSASNLTSFKGLQQPVQCV